MLRIKNFEYIIINTIFVVIIVLILIYSLIFAKNGNYPIKSSCVDINDQICISKGLSRAFSQIMLGNFEKAKGLNQYSLLIFSFLFIQIIFRIILSVFYVISQKKVIITIDIIFSVLFFIYCLRSFLSKLLETIVTP